MSEAQSLYVILSANATQYQRVMEAASREMRKFGGDVDDSSRKLDDAGQALDRYSGRLRIVLDALGAAGSAFIPLGGVAAAGAAGLGGLLGAAAVGAGGLLVATRGVGDALKEVEKARLEPTVANLQAAELALDRIAPAAREWVREFEQLMPLLEGIRDSGAQELFPGLTESLRNVEQLASVLEDIVAATSRAGGDAAASATASLTTDRWAPFLGFLENEAPAAIRDVTELVGTLAHAGAELWMSFDPGNDRFVSWLKDVANGFDEWASSPQGRQDVERFLDYVQQNGPAVEEFVVAIAEAFAQVTQAAAPLGGPVLQILTGFAKAVAAIADSDLGTPIFTAIAGYTALNRVLQVTAGLQTRIAGSSALGDGLRAGGVVGGIKALRGQERDIRATAAAAAKGTAALAGLTVAATGAADGVGLSNTASLAMLGTLAGPWGAAVGAGAGILLDFASAGDKAADGLKLVNDGLAATELETKKAALAQLKEQYADFLEPSSGWWDGFTDDFKAGLIVLGGGGDEAAATADKMRRLAREIRELEDTERGVAAQERVVEHLRVNRQAAMDTAASFITLGKSLNDSEVSLGDWIGELEEQTRALRDFRINAEEAADRGLRRGLIRELEAAGREGALRLAQLADASETEIRRANRAWAAGRREAELYGTGVYAAVEAFRDLPKEARTYIRAMGIPETMAEVEDLVTLYDLTGKERKALIRLVDHASGPIQDVIDKLNGVDGKSVDTFINVFKRNLTTGGGGRQPGGIDELLGADPKREDANGGLYDGPRRAFAGGGYGSGGRYYDRVSQIVKGGANILWGEQETGWEAYISGKPSQRERNLGIWAETGRRLGVERGPRGRESASGGRSGSRTVVVQAAMPDAVELVVDGHSFTAYVRGHAADVASRQLDVADRNGESNERMNWS
ncbi:MULTISPECIES: hypothetical protein [unclassified Nocardioides]|uniref:hypothetical protein n=1 Tax=unclassified Nocardioides TaxID=2615069 RepID=UPI000702FE99|nr:MULTISPECIES: hypothetical protein [unclassified Nocardioides]KRC53932.1 hypothetical protein ASE19_07580 [Nocardioides sp. Root79]KRC71268.1 hypothetical protein ASE20_09995 [Nocardioides sp. Root240]